VTNPLPVVEPFVHNGEAFLHASVDVRSQKHAKNWDPVIFGCGTPNPSGKIRSGAASADDSIRLFPACGG
jgi:hypothetical protein